MSTISKLIVTIVTVVLFVAALCQTCNAQSGAWYAYQTTTGGQENPRGYSPYFFEVMANPIEQGTGLGFGAVQAPYPVVPVTVDNSGSVTTTFYFEAAPGTEPPQRLTLREFSYSSAVDGFSALGTQISPLLLTNVDDAIGDPTTNLHTDKINYNVMDNTVVQSCGARVYTLDTTDVLAGAICPGDGHTYTGITSITRNYTDSGTVTWSPPDYNVTVGCSLWDEFSLDNRSVSIPIPQTTKKEPLNVSEDGGVEVDSDGDPLLVMPPPNNTADADGTMYGDIGIPDGEYAYEFGPGYGETLQPQQDSLKVKYEAALTGSWSANPITFAWSSNLGSTEFVPPPQPTVPVFWDQYWGAEMSMDGSKVQDWGDTEKTATIKVAATDPADGTTATGKYKMTIHRGIEVLPSNKPCYRIDTPLTIRPVSPGWAGKDSSISFNFGYDPYGWGDASLGLTLFGAIPDIGWVATALVAAGLGTAALAPVQDSNIAVFDVCWANTEDNPQGPTFTSLHSLPITPKPAESLDGGDFDMYPHAMGGYTPKWSLYDYYGGGGFSHEEKHYISKFTGLYTWGQFKQVTADPQYP